MSDIRDIQPQSCFYHSRGLRLHYLDWGNIGAPVLILLHGGLEHARVWDQLVRQLCSDWHVVVPDLRGHGDSEWSSGGAYSIVDMVPDLAALLAELGEPVIHLVGHSLGGNVAIHYTALFPQRVARLCVIEGLGFSPEARARRDRRSRLEQLRQWVGKAREVDLRRPRGYASIAEAVARLREHDPLLSPELASQVCEHGMRINERGLWQWKYDPRVRASGPSEVASPEPSDLWRAITGPVLLMYGARSWASDPEQDGRMAHFAAVRRVLIEDAGHNLHHHRPEEFLTHLQAFLHGAD